MYHTLPGVKPGRPPQKPYPRQTALLDFKPNHISPIRLFYKRFNWLAIPSTCSFMPEESARVHEVSSEIRKATS